MACWYGRPEKHGLRCLLRIKVVLTGKPAKWVSGKDVILHMIGMIGVDGALYQFLGVYWAMVLQVPVHGRSFFYLLIWQLRPVARMAFSR